MSGNRFYPRKGTGKGRYVAAFSGRNRTTNKWKRNIDHIPREVLAEWYHAKHKSMPEVASVFGCSIHKVAYWMEKYKIPRRKLNDAMYAKHNPGGDPFKFVPPRTAKEAQLFGLGLGLYWGQGTRANLDSIRLGSMNPKLIAAFVLFLQKFFTVDVDDLRFGLQVFSDVSPVRAMDFWIENLKIKRGQFYKVTVTRSGSIGTYRHKNQYGVMTVYYHNKKARALLGSLLPE